MKLTRKIVVALAVLMAAGVAYAEIPDVSKWSCPKGVVESHPDYGAEFTVCDNLGLESFYLKVSGELVYIHEHRMDKGKTVYYNALKTNEGNWVEMVNEKDFIFNAEEIENSGIMTSIIDDDGKVIAKRITPLLKK